MWQKIKPYVIPFAVSISIPVAVGLFAALLTKNNMNIYEKISTPPLSPPGWLFPIVWTLLYVLMGVSSALIYINKEKNPPEAKQGLYYYALSLAANFLWSIICFNLGAFLFALICLGVLLYLIIKTIISYRRITPTAAYLQIPYAVWVTFAGYLNVGIFILNM
jgi:tryptophan-rich sensory protein